MILLLCHRKPHEPEAESSRLPCHSTPNKSSSSAHCLALRLLSAAHVGSPRLWMIREGPPFPPCTHHASSLLPGARPFLHVLGFSCQKCAGHQTHTSSELTKKNIKHH